MRLRQFPQSLISQKQIVDCQPLRKVRIILARKKEHEVTKTVLAHQPPIKDPAFVSERCESIQSRVENADV